MMDWHKYITALAKEKGMCAKFQEGLAQCTNKIDAIQLYMQNPVWALRNDYPDIDFLMKEFQYYDAEGFYVNHYFTGEVLNELDCYVLHNCTGDLCLDFNVSKCIIPMLYVTNGCDIRISATDDGHCIPTTINVYSYGNNNIRIENGKFIKFKVLKP